MNLTTRQQRVLVSIVEGAGTTQRFGRWSKATYDALKRRGLMTTKKVDAPDDCYAVWRVDLTQAGRAERAKLIGLVAPFPFPDYGRWSSESFCWHDPHYPVGEWRCVLKRGHSDFHRYAPRDLII